MQAYQRHLAALEAADTQVLGVSMDSPYANKAFAKEIGVTFPLLSDWGGAVTRAYGVYEESSGTPRRVTYLIGKDGIVARTQVDSEAIDPAAIVSACTATGPEGE